MKNKYMIGSLAALLMVPAMTSCSSSFLDEAPLTSITVEMATGSEEGALAAVSGISRQMQRQFSDLKNGNMNFSGETNVTHWFGDALGPDDNVGEVTNYMRSGITPGNFRYATGWWPAWMYNYCYSIIYEANSILTSTGLAPQNSNMQWVVASALTMRAHAYCKLMQVFAPRWQDSNNGNAYCIVFRLSSDEPNDKPFSTCNEVYDQLYADLDLAIDLFNKSDMDRGSQLFLVDASVARGIYARIALLKNDYQTAQKMAHDARQKYPIMSPQDYVSGFSTVNKEWMWAPAMDYLGVYYWGFGPHYACNGHYVKSWGYSDSMQYTLYKNFKASDVRSQLYFGPLCIQHEPEMAAELGITEEDFFDASVYTSTTYGISITGSGTSPGGKMQAMWDFIMEYGKRFAQYRPEDDKGIYVTNSKGLSLGVQFKFQGLPDGYSSCYPPYMRGSEMLLIEAEAAYQNGDNSTATSCLQELMAQRDPEYKLPATSGQGLFDEIKLQRRLELFGEGFNWFDFKRWNDVITYPTLNLSNPDWENMGSYPTTVANTYQPDFMMGWRAAIPQSEFIYNKLANPADVGQ